MRLLFPLLLLLPLGAQELTVRCEPTPQTIRLLESVPPLRDTAIPYEQRVGALRALAQKYPDDFFIQRAYQDSFRQLRSLADEYDRALALYRARPGDPLSRYYEARLLLWSAPQRSKDTLTEYLESHPEFVWPHLDLLEWNALPGKRFERDTAAHRGAFFRACPDALGMAPRSVLERRNTPLELLHWPEIWESEADGARIRADLKRIEAWPFRADPDLYHVYQEAARIAKDPGILQALRGKVEHNAPNSLLALSFVENDWEEANPVPDRNAPPAAWSQRYQKELQAQREWVRRWPNAWSLLASLLMKLSATSESPATVPGSDLEVIDQALRVHAMSPDGSEFWPPIETEIAGIYAAGKVRLDRVPALLDAGTRNIEKMYKYNISMELFPAEIRGQATDWRTITARHTEEARVEYLLAMKRPADARSLIEQTLAKLDAAEAASPQEPKAERCDWMRRLATAEAQEGLVENALAHYQASIPAWDRKNLAVPEAQPMFAAAKQYYLAHGGTEEKWLDWATSGSKVPMPGPKALSFLTDLPEFSTTDLAGRTWQLRDLQGKATFVNFWATWCGPCRGEHPGIQEIYDRIKDRTDVQVLTVSVDDHAAAARQYMKEAGYTFPVICGAELASKLFPYVGLPTNFIVNRQGKRTSYYPFSPDSRSVALLIDELAKIAKPLE
jgi:thiol-disulfide isomerase/thioredoxin